MFNAKVNELGEVPVAFGWVVGPFHLGSFRDNGTTIQRTSSGQKSIQDSSRKWVATVGIYIESVEYIELMYSVFICTSNVQLCWSIEESLHEVVLTARGDDLKIDTKLETKLHIYNQYIVYSISIIYIYIL